MHLFYYKLCFIRNDNISICICILINLFRNHVYINSIYNKTVITRGV